MVHIGGILPADSQQGCAPSELALVSSDGRDTWAESTAAHIPAGGHCLAAGTASPCTSFFDADNFTIIGQIRHNLYIGELGRGREGKKTCQSYLCPRYIFCGMSRALVTLMTRQVWFQWSFDVVFFSVKSYRPSFELNDGWKTVLIQLADLFVVAEKSRVEGWGLGCHPAEVFLTCDPNQHPQISPCLPFQETSQDRDKAVKILLMVQSLTSQYESK